MSQRIESQETARHRGELDSPAVREGHSRIVFRARDKSGITRRQLERGLSVISPLLLLALWQLGTWQGIVDTRFFPAPSTILMSLWDMTTRGELLNCRYAVDQSLTAWCSGFERAPVAGHLGISALRIVVGYAIGVIPGILLGLAMGLFGPLRAMIQPLIDATFPIPKIAILPLLIVLLGIGEASKIALIAIATFFIVVINAAAGVRGIDKIYRDVGRNFQAGRFMMFRDVALPGALPQIMTGMRLAAGIALLAIVAAEFVAADSGIGYLIWTSWQVFEVERMYGGLVIIAGLGFTTGAILRALQSKVIPWQVESTTNP